MAKLCQAHRESRFAPSKRTSSVFAAEPETQIPLLALYEIAPEFPDCHRFAIPASIYTDKLSE